MDNHYSDISIKLYDILRCIHQENDFKGIRGPTDRIEMDHSLKRYIFKTLYYYMTNEGEQIKFLFPDSDVQYDSIQDVFKTFSQEETDFYKLNNSHLNNKNAFKHAGRNCGRKFKVGEPLYRCHECGFDDTCVLCINCFNPKDHENHHIYTDICNDFTTGICDCGDEEAWNSELNCKADEFDTDVAKDNENEILFDEKLIEVVLAEAFDYLIELFNQNIESLPTFTKDITMKLREMVQSEKTDDINSFLKEFRYTNDYMDQTTDEEQDNSYTVLIYNDEYHNYSQATMALRQGAPDNVHTDILTSKVDSEGRAMLKCSNNVHDLMAGFFAVQTNGLSATLTSWSEYVHQEACKYIVQWLAHCLTLPNSNFQSSFRNALGSVLCSQGNLGRSTNVVSRIKKYFPNKMDENNQHRYLDLSILTEENTIPLGYHKVLPESSLNSISNTLNKFETLTYRYYSNTRLQHLLYFDNRFWKKLRKDLQNIIIPTLSSSIIYKSIFCEQVVEIFNHMSRLITYMDREPQLTALRECVVQLFTCPKNASLIFENPSGYFIDIVWSIIDIFVEFSKIENGTIIWQRVQKTNPSKSYGISLKQGLYTIETLLSKVNDPNILIRPREFISVVTLCKLFNGAWKIKRKEGEHVLHEDQHFIPYLEYTTSVYSIIQTIVNALVSQTYDQALLLNAIRLISTLLGYKSLTYKIVHNSHEVIKFCVSSERVAFMNPVHTFFSFLIENVPLIKAYETIVYQDSVARSPSPVPLDSTDNIRSLREQYDDRASQSFDFLKISDFALRSVVLCSQIDVGFWVRNGMSVLHQISYYKNNPELNTYSRDIHLNQLAFLWEIDDTPRIIYNLLDRWELLDWFDGKADLNKTVYEDKIFLIIQHFIAFVYQILTERQFFQTFESPREKKMSQIKNAIIYNLYTKNLSYSKLLRFIPDYLTENSTDFDTALNEVSIFKEPKGLADNGVFKMKESLYAKIDPLRLSNLGNEFESSACIIKTHLNKGNADEASKVILQPQLLSPKHIDEDARLLGSFTRHTIFAKVIYKLLQACLDSEDGTFLNELLHLIHGIFKDDEHVNGKSSIPEAYLSKPICNLLLSISNAKSDVFSESITTKADYLLKRMIMKKPEEIFGSLIASFGEDCINDYKNKKLSEGVNLEETEREKKRRLAKKHQARLMAKFNNQQSKFMKENEGEFKEREREEQLEEDGDVNMTESEKTVDSEDFICSLCQDNTSTDIFVVPAYHDHTPIFRSGNITDVNEYMTDWNGFKNTDTGTVHIDDNNLSEISKDGSLNTRKVFVSCNHHIHYNCFKRYIQKKRFSSTAFICPLCQTFSNIVIAVRPTCISSNQIDIYNEKNPIWYHLDGSLKHITEKQATDIFSIFDSIFSDSHSFDRNYFVSDEYRRENTAIIMATNWANTISMLEVSSRLDKSPNETFLLGKEQKYKTLKNILIFIILIRKIVGPPINDENVYPQMVEENSDLFINQLFQYIVKECLFTSKPMKNVIKDAICCYSQQFFKQFFEEYNIYFFEEEWEHITAEYSSPVIPSNLIIEHLQMYLLDDEMRFSNIDDGTLVKIKSLAYTSFLKHILPTLRRSLIMIKTFQLLSVESEEEPFIIDGINIANDLIPSSDLSLKDIIDRMVAILTKEDDLDTILLQDYSKDEKNLYLKNIPNEYSGIVKLVNLSKYLNTYVTDTKAIRLREENKHIKNASNRLDFKICLTCGVKIYQRSDRHEISRHLAKHCFKPFGAFLIPNSSEICLYLSHPPSYIFVSAPYLNSHGEAGRNAMKRGDLTTLNLSRFEHLNKLWINNEIPGYISRVMGDEFRVSILSNGFLFAFNRDPRTRRAPPADDDSEDDFMASGDEGLYSDEDSDEENRFRNANGQPGDVRDFFQIFETVRNAMDNGGNGNEGVDLTTPFLQMLGPQFRGPGRTDDDINDDENPFDDPDGQDENEPHNAW